MTIRKVRVLLLVILVLAILPELAAHQEQRSVPPTDETISGSSDLFAAFLVAFKEHQEWWRSQTVQLTPKELTERHYAVRCMRKDAGRIIVRFFPQSPDQFGGSTVYIVDRGTLKVIERSFER